MKVVRKPELLGFKYSYIMENIRIGSCGKTDKNRLSYLEPNNRSTLKLVFFRRFSRLWSQRDDQGV